MKIVVVAGVLIKDSEVLIGKKKPNPGHFLSGQWHIPGGKVDRGETETDALKREIDEETGLTVEVTAYIDETIQLDYVVRYYFIQATGGRLLPGDDLDEVKFVPLADMTSYCSANARKAWPPKVQKLFSL